MAQALKVVPWLKRSGKATRIDWVVDSDYLPVLEICPDLDRLIGFPRKKWRRSFSPGEMLAWAKELRRERYDVVLDLQGLARSGLMTRLARASHRVGLESAREGASWAYARRVQDHQRHAVDRYATAVAHVLGETQPPAPLSFPSPATPLPAGLEPGRYTVFHPYSLWATKLWPWQKFQALERALAGETIVWVGSGTFFPTGSATSVDLRGKTPLPLLLSLLGQARAVISTDSGPAHLAALFDVPVITLFGATDPTLTSPRSQRGRDPGRARPSLPTLPPAHLPLERPLGLPGTDPRGTGRGGLGKTHPRGLIPLFLGAPGLGYLLMGGFRSSKNLLKKVNLMHLAGVRSAFIALKWQ